MDFNQGHSLALSSHGWSLPAQKLGVNVLSSLSLSAYSFHHFFGPQPRFEICPQQKEGPKAKEYTDQNITSAHCSTHFSRRMRQPLYFIPCIRHLSTNLQAHPLQQSNPYPTTLPLCRVSPRPVGPSRAQVLLSDLIAQYYSVASSIQSVSCSSTMNVLTARTADRVLARDRTNCLRYN